jgi:hypothetical protein
MWVIYFFGKYYYLLSYFLMFTHKQQVKFFNYIFLTFFYIILVALVLGLFGNHFMFYGDYEYKKVLQDEQLINRNINLNRFILILGLYGIRFGITYSNQKFRYN